MEDTLILVATAAGPAAMVLIWHYNRPRDTHSRLERVFEEAIEGKFDSAMEQFVDMSAAQIRRDKNMQSQAKRLLNVLQRAHWVSRDPKLWSGALGRVRYAAVAKFFDWVEILEREHVVSGGRHGVRFGPVGLRPDDLQASIRKALGLTT